MSDPTSTAVPTASIEITRDEANLILEGLGMLLNCRRYSFKESHEDVRELHASVFQAYERIEGVLREAFPPR